MSANRNFVYYLHDEVGEVIYVGRSQNVAGRIAKHAWEASSSSLPQHRQKADWYFRTRSISMRGPYDRDAAVAEERREIERLQPVGNIRLTKRDRWVRANRTAVSA